MKINRKKYGSNEDSKGAMNRKKYGSNEDKQEKVREQ